ncbi:hypothetical protein [Rahnella sp. ChDrAdgB13]|uniref:hypothetical protein n=1 Tax=Rahnella sp. ChDrAdgB13 TaxID=1850581 RepID=UPI001AD85953|nr:hypothetical protein [Rahnella sp. ChDrAdgB13]
MSNRNEEKIKAEIERTGQQYRVLTASQSELYSELKKWFEGRIKNLNTVLEHKDADLNFGEGLEIKAGTNKAKGFHVGIMIARHLLGEFPEFQFVRGSDLHCEDEGGDNGDH